MVFSAKLSATTGKIIQFSSPCLLFLRQKFTIECLMLCNCSCHVSFLSNKSLRLKTSCYAICLAVFPFCRTKVYDWKLHAMQLFLPRLLSFCGFHFT